MELMKTIADDVQEDLDVCRECTGTWKVACYGAWYPKSQFWEDFLEGEWEEGAYAPRAVCLRLMCGMLFCFFAPIWCCKAVLFFLFWPCVCCVRTLWEGNCNRDYCRTRRSRKPTSQPLTYIESAQPTRPVSLPSPPTLLVLHSASLHIVTWTWCIAGSCVCTSCTPWPVCNCESCIAHSTLIYPL